MMKGSNKLYSSLDNKATSTYSSFNSKQAYNSFKSPAKSQVKSPLKNTLEKNILYSKMDFEQERLTVDEGNEKKRSPGYVMSNSSKNAMNQVFGLSGTNTMKQGIQSQRYASNGMGSNFTSFAYNNKIENSNGLGSSYGSGGLGPTLGATIAKGMAPQISPVDSQRTLTSKMYSTPQNSKKDKLPSVQTDAFDLANMLASPSKNSGASNLNNQVTNSSSNPQNLNNYSNSPTNNQKNNLRENKPPEKQVRRGTVLSSEVASLGSQGPLNISKDSFANPNTKDENYSKDTKYESKPTRAHSNNPRRQSDVSGITELNDKKIQNNSNSTTTTDKNGLVSNKISVKYEKQSTEIKDRGYSKDTKESRKAQEMKISSSVNKSKTELKKGTTVVNNDSDSFLGKKDESSRFNKDKEKDSNNVNNSRREEKKSELIRNSLAKSAAGVNFDGEIKTNQDSYIAKRKVLGFDNFSIFSVFDGHGPYGHYVSYFLKHNIAAYFSNKDLYSSSSYDQSPTDRDFYNVLKKNNYEIVRRSYLKADHDLKSERIETSLSGSTAVTALLLGNKIICANAGDSRGILVNEKIVKNKETFVPTAISRDHKPELPEEKARIEKSGGAVRKFSETEDDVGPYRVWKKNEELPGLAMSRSIGDFIAKSCGVIAEPEILEFDITNESRFLVMASDGVWEFLSNNKVTELVAPYYKNGDISKACDKLIDEATKCWKAEDCIVDDITVIIVFF